MINWCNNKIRVFHQDKIKMQQLVEAIGDNKFLEYTLSMRGVHNDLEHNEWDKNPTGSIIYNDEKTGILFEFNSEWYPPYGVVEFLKSAGFSVKMWYFVFNECFTGIWDDGVDTRYEMMSEKSELDIPDELDSMFDIRKTFQVANEYPID